MKISKKIYFYLASFILLVIGLLLYAEYNFNKTYLEKSRYTDDLPAVEVKEEIATTSVRLYYYNQKKDTDPSGNIQCSEEGLEYVIREIPKTNTPLKDSLDLLIKGELTKAEKESGLSTEYPLEGLEIKSIAMSDSGVLSIDINDPARKTVGGACRTGILARQIVATAKQFDVVKEVDFISPEVFQP